MKGKVTGQRVLDVDCPTIETSVSSIGTAKGIQINETLTYIGKPSSQGVIRGKGHGVFIYAESDIAAWTGDGDGRMVPSGTKWYGAIFFTAGSTGKLTFLNDVVAVFEAEIDREGNGNKFLLFGFVISYTILCSCFAHSQGDPKHTLCVPSLQGMQILFEYLDVPPS